MLKSSIFIKINRKNSIVYQCNRYCRFWFLLYEQVWRRWNIWSSKIKRDIRRCKFLVDVYLMALVLSDDISRKFRGTYTYTVCSRRAPFNRKSVALSVPRFPVEISRTYPHAVTHAMEHKRRNAARLKSTAAAGEIMNELDLRKIRPVHKRAALSSLSLYLFIFHPSKSNLFRSNDRYKFFCKWFLNGDYHDLSQWE